MKSGDRIVYFREARYKQSYIEATPDVLLGGLLSIGVFMEKDDEIISYRKRSVNYIKAMVEGWEFKDCRYDFLSSFYLMTPEQVNGR